MRKEIFVGCFGAVAAGLMAAAQAEDEAYLIDQGSRLIADGTVGNPGGVLANEGGGIDLVAGDLVGEGTLETQSDGSFVYTPPAQFFGEVSFTYEANELIVTEIVGEDADWRFLALSSTQLLIDPDLLFGWATVDYNDVGLPWRDGTGLMGYGTIGDLELDTEIPDADALTAYFRHEFESNGAIDDLFLRLVRDDAAIVYLNGVEVVRSSDAIGAFDTAPNSPFLAGPVGSPEGAELRHELTASTQDGTNVLAISLHNAATTSSDLGLHVRSLATEQRGARIESEATIIVADAMVPPQIRSDRYLFTPGETLDSTSSFSLYDNDGVLSAAGVAYDPITEIVIGGNAAAMVTVDQATGHFTFVPDAALDSDTSFTYRLRDKDGLSSQAFVQLVAYTGDLGAPPIGRPDMYSTVQGTLLAVASPGVLANDGGATETALEVMTDHGTLVFEADGSFDYQPNPNFIGTDSFDYSAVEFLRTTLMNDEQTWKWFHPLNGVDPATRIPGFDDSWTGSAHDVDDWWPGSGLMGYGTISSPTGNIPIATPIGLPPEGFRRTTYFRSNFTAPPGEHTLEVNLLRDDGAIVYVNGEELVRSVEPATAADLRFGAADRYSLMVPAGDGFWVDTSVEGRPKTHRIEGVNLHDGANLMAISLHNTTAGGAAASSDLALRVNSVVLLEPSYSLSTATIEVTDGFQRPVLSFDSYEVLVGQTLEAVGEMSVFANDGLFDENGVAYDPIADVQHTTPGFGDLLSFDDSNGEFSFRSDLPGHAEFTYDVEDKDGIASSPARVSIEVRDTEASWRARNFPAGAGDEIAGPLADPDMDGIVNQLEFALGLDPNKPDVGGGISFLPIALGREQWTVEFDVVSPSPTDLIYSVEMSPDLLTWSEVARQDGTGLETGGWELVLSPDSPFVSLGVNRAGDKNHVNLAGSDLDGIPLYMRLRVSSPAE